MTTRTIVRAAGLHPDDLAARHALLGGLAHLRETTDGVSQTTIGQALGISADAVRLAEQSTADPCVDRLQRHLRATRHQLVLNPRFDPDLPADNTTAMFRAMADAAADPDQADMYHRSAVLHHLIARRRWLGKTARDISRQLGRSDSAIGQLEQDAKPAMLSSYQLYTRAVGGILHLDIEPIHQLEGATP